MNQDKKFLRKINLKKWNGHPDAEMEDKVHPAAIMDLVSEKDVNTSFYEIKDSGPTALQIVSAVASGVKTSLTNATWVEVSKK